MQGAASQTILVAAHYDILVAVVGKVIGITEIVVEPGGSPVDEYSRLVPVNKAVVQRCGMGNGGTAIVNGGIEDVGCAIVVVNATAPATFKVVGLTGGDGYGFFPPLVEVFRTDVSPVQACHVGAVGIFLEIQMVAPVAVGHAVALVGPSG